jgi:hypothetical protein
LKRINSPVIAGLDPAIKASDRSWGLDAPVKPGHDDEW